MSAAPTSSPADSSSPCATSQAVVIGSGFGGLASAIRLRARGYRVTLLEMNDSPGGLAHSFEDSGFRWDAGPTILTAPFLIDELFELSGRQRADYLTLKECDPCYRISYHDGSHFDYTSNEEKMLEQIRAISPGDVEGYHAFMAKSERIFQRAFLDLSDQPFTSFWDMMRCGPDLLKLGAHESVHAFAARHLRDPRLRFVFSFHPLFVGGHPFRSSAIYGMIHYLERKWGVHFAMGGTGALVDALVRLFQDMGGELRLNARVEHIEIAKGRVEGVKFRDLSTLDSPVQTLPAKVVVSNASVVNTYSRLVGDKHNRTWRSSRLKRMKHSVGLFMIYFGTNKRFDGVLAHNIVLGPRYKELLDELFDRGTLADDFSLYVYLPTRIDPSLAPEGGESGYILSLVPNLGGKVDWAREKERYAETILTEVEQRLLPGLRDSIVVRHLRTPEDFASMHDLHLGAPFQFQPLLTQSAWFRPHNVSEDIQGLYLAGAGTHPGAGVPGVIASAKILDKVVPDPVKE